MKTIQENTPEIGIYRRRIDLLEWWIKPESCSPFSDSTKEMMKREVKELKTLLAQKGQIK